MIEDGGTFATICIVALTALCIAMAWKQRKGLSEMEAGHLYMMFYFGAQSAATIKNELADEYTASQVFWDLVKLEKLGLVERTPEWDEVWLGRHGRFYEMTDAGKTMYRDLAEQYDLPYSEPDFDPREEYKCERD